MGDSSQLLLHFKDKTQPINFKSNH